MKRQNKLWLYLFLAVLLPRAMGQVRANSLQEEKPANVSGIVINSLTGEPLAHAHVSFDTFAQTKGSRYGAVSNASGQFSIAGMTPGNYHMFAERRGYGDMLDVEANGAGAALQLKSGENVKNIVVRLVPDAVISGRVVDAKGAPMEHIDVTAVGGVQPYHAQTDDRGEFRLGGVRAGRYFVRALTFPPPLPPEVRSDGTSEINYGPTYYPNSPDAKSAALVQPRAGQETSGIEIKLVPSPVLSVSGTASGFSLKENAQFTVELRGAHMRTEARVGADQKFIFWRVPRGHYQLFAQYIDFSARKAMRGAPVEIDLIDSSITGIHLDVSASFELSGHIRIEGGAAWSEETAAYDMDIQPLGLRINIETPSVTLNRQDGSFKIETLYPGRYRLVMGDLRKGFYIKSVQLEGKEFPNSILDFHGPASGPLTVELGKDGAEIFGAVQDAKGPVAGMQVALFFDNAYSDLASTTVSGAEGRYAFYGLAPGKYRILAYDRKKSGGDWSSGQGDWLSDQIALYESVIEKLDVSTGDKVSQDLRLLP
ncbi:MAG TPA: carboxypeptidase-like regulatory domain-containing protein [Verrucomicrobiae bacterium]|jgi:hypothetical protein|nr:carboxypeptidase-like regulatory domain-containing protein [Verrucomicrobiae bacterium]